MRILVVEDDAKTAAFIHQGLQQASYAVDHMALVTYLNQLLRDGVLMHEAALRGSCRRLRPVLMTAITTALGLLTSTILTLLVIQALYKWFAISIPRDVHSPERREQISS